MVLHPSSGHDLVLALGGDALQGAAPAGCPLEVLGDRDVVLFGLAQDLAQGGRVLRVPDNREQLVNDESEHNTASTEEASPISQRSKAFSPVVELEPVPGDPNQIVHVGRRHRPPGVQVESLEVGDEGAPLLLLHLPERVGVLLQDPPVGRPLAPRVPPVSLTHLTLPTTLPVILCATSLSSTNQHSCDTPPGSNMVKMSGSVSGVKGKGVCNAGPRGPPLPTDLLPLPPPALSFKLRLAGGSSQPGRPRRRGPGRGVPRRCSRSRRRKAYGLACFSPVPFTHLPAHQTVLGLLLRLLL